MRSVVGVICIFAAVIVMTAQTASAWDGLYADSVKVVSADHTLYCATELYVSSPLFCNGATDNTTMAGNRYRAVRIGPRQFLTWVLVGPTLATCTYDGTHALRPWRCALV